MFLRRTRGLLDLLIASLCVWGACYHTPVGAAVRGIVSIPFGRSTSARSVLAHYNGGVYAPEPLNPSLVLPKLALHAPVPEADALGYGTYAAWSSLPAPERQRAKALALAARLPVGALEDPREGPKVYARLLRALSRELKSEEAAVVATLCGYEPARYAQERALAESGGELGLEHIARQLPPGFEEEIAAASQAMMLGRAYGLAWPAVASAPITSPFGLRRHPMLGQSRMHKGVDISLRIGTPVLAVDDGVVVEADQDSVNGVHLTLDHGRGVTTLYCHNSRHRVRRGQWVKKGDVIAESGNSGMSTGPHLHYQLELARVPVDPLQFRAQGVPVTSSEVGP
jgi:murein DD-endopeptidase